jgi:DNA-binding transcriptional MocR family regulator
MDYINKIVLSKTSKVPMYQQLGDSLHKLIFEGKLAPNYKLPPIRIMAEKLNVNTSTVINAYKYLENKKVVYSQMGSGTYVSPLLISDIPEPVLNSQINTFDKRTRYKLENALNFATTSTSENLFPVDEFKQIFNEVLERDKGLAFNYQESQGYPPLRKSICNYLSYYGIKSSYEKIQIISGAQQGIDIISKAILKSSDIVFVEKPTYYGAIGAFASRGAEIIEIPLEKDGIDINLLESYMKLYTPKFIYIMTYYQTPTSISYSLEKKRKLLQISEKYDTYIIEEDNLSDFNYSETPNIPLKALDYKNRVIYIKSFSKILMPGLRLGFMILPQKIMQEVNLAKHTTDISTSGFIQRALDLYLQNDLWIEHTKYVCNIYKKRYEQIIKFINKYLKDYVEYIPPNGGLTLWLKFNTVINIEDFCNKLLEENIIVSPGTLFSLSEENMPYIRISFASVKKEDIPNGIKAMQKTLNQMLSAE